MYHTNLLFICVYIISVIQNTTVALNCNDRRSPPRTVATFDLNIFGVYQCQAKIPLFFFCSLMLSLHQCKLRLKLLLQLLQTMQVVQN